MNKQPSPCHPRALACPIHSAFSAALLPALLLLLTIQTSRAGSATWKLNPPSGDWNTAANWTPAAVPNGPSDVATFDVSNRTTLTLLTPIEVNEIVFNADASAFAISVSNTSLTLSGAGITNHTVINQDFYVSGGTVTFQNSAAITNPNYPGEIFIYAEGGSSSTDRAIVSFTDTTNAGVSGDTTFIMNQTTAGNVFGGETIFTGTSTPGGAQIYNLGAASPGAASTCHGLTVFAGNSNAGESEIQSFQGAYPDTPGGETDFIDSASAGGAYIVGTTGVIKFFDDSTGDACHIGLYGKGVLDISPHNPPGVTIGSFDPYAPIRGGKVFLGANNLTVGNDNLTSTFSGVIADGGSAGGTGGSLTKINTGTVTLNYFSLYTGGTVVSAGALLVRNTSGSATGPGAVDVAAGSLGGRGIISGAVTIGTGSGPGAFLSPSYAAAKAQTLSLLSTLTFEADASYTWTVRGNAGIPAADEVIANGVTIDPGATFSITARTKLPSGTVFTAISNASALPIAGAFSNLADGSTLTVGNNTYLVSYEGGDGNDLTLTVQ